MLATDKVVEIVETMGYQPPSASQLLAASRAAERKRIEHAMPHPTIKWDETGTASASDRRRRFCRQPHAAR